MLGWDWHGPGYTLATPLLRGYKVNALVCGLGAHILQESIIAIFNTSTTKNDWTECAAACSEFWEYNDVDCYYQPELIDIGLWQESTWHYQPEWRDIGLWQETVHEFHTSTCSPFHLAQLYVIGKNNGLLWSNSSIYKLIPKRQCSYAHKLVSLANWE